MTQASLGRRRVNWWWFALPVVLLLGCAAYGVLRYSSLPPVIATHWDASGAANGFSAKSVAAAFTGVFAFAGFLLVMAAVSLLVAKSRFKATFGLSEDESEVRGTAASNASLVFLGVVANALSLMMALASLAVFSARGVQVPVYVPLGIVAAGLALGGWAAWRRYRRGLASAGQSPALPDDSGHWIAGTVYNNPDDKRVWVPKRLGSGLTVNWATTGGKLFCLGILAALLAALFIGLLA